MTTLHRFARTWLVYALTLVAGVALFFWIASLGDGMSAPQTTSATPFGASRGGAKGDALLHVLLALATILIAAQALGWLFKKIHQPAVIGEVIAGILLGPSLLGRVWPDGYAFLLPASVAPYLGVIAQVGVILFMFVVGLELDPKVLRQRTHSTVAISHASIIVPFLLGSALALFLYSRLSSSDVPFTAFALFIGISMSVTAFPVLARILTDRGIQRTRVGVIALTCAAVDDVTAWCLLALVVGVVQSTVDNALWTIVATAVFALTMFFVVRPAVGAFARRHEAQGLNARVLCITAILLLLSALATEWIGIHALFGAFLLGALVPHDSRIARELRERIEGLVLAFFLPAFFAYTGMRTQIGLVSGLEPWLLCGLIIVVASLGKFGGSFVAGRLTGLSWNDAAAVGVLMNTRGLMELIVLNIGLDLGVLSPVLFAMLVIMAIVTTMATTPVLDRLRVRDDPVPAGLAPTGRS